MAEFADRISALSPKKRELLLLKLRAADGDLREQPIPARDRARETFPLSFAQRRLWFLEQLEPGSPAFNLHGGLLLNGPLDVPALFRSLNELVRRHHALRSMFTLEHGEPAQVVQPYFRLAVPFLDLSALPEPTREREVRRLAALEAARSFDLGRGPIVRTTLLRLSSGSHVLLPVMHHIVSDAWSMGIFFRELGILYGAFAAKKPSPLAEPELQYGDFAVWQLESLSHDRLEHQLSFWRDRLSGAPEMLELPVDHPYPARPSHRSAITKISFSSKITDQLRSLGQRHKATLFMVLLAVFKVLLLKFTGQEDLLVGTPIANRSRPELEGIFGFFVNTLVLRTDLDGDPSFAEVLRRVRQVTIEVFEHQDLPFERLVEDLRPERSVTRHPIFQVAFQLQNTPLAAPDFQGIIVSPLEADSGAATFDLSLSFTEVETGLFGLLQYSTDLFDACTAARLALSFRTLVDAVIASPGQRLSQISVLTEEERAQVLTEWNLTAAEYPRDKCIHQLVEEHTLRDGEHLAIVTESHRLTYRELNERSNRLARYLAALQIGPEIVTGIFLERSVEMMVAILAVLKTGGAYLPLDPAYPEERLKFMLSDSGARVLLTSRHLSDCLLTPHQETVILDDVELPPDDDSPNPVGGVCPQNLAYLIYTSGSTGQPKGVAIQHQGLVNLATWHRTSYAIGPGDQTTHLAGLSFDASVWEMWSSLAAGATLHLIPDEVRTDPATLWATYIKDEITHSFLPTPLAEALLAGPEQRSGSMLRSLLVGGDRLSAPPHVPMPFTLENHYGPTETTVVATSALVDIKCVGAPPIGRPIANMQAYILDKFGQPVPQGVIGELYIGGDGLARGYVGQPALTAEQFVPDAFDSRQGGRLYRTGDRARFSRDGNIEFVGRADRQVKLRGFRIELGEIESALRAHPSIRQAAVVMTKAKERSREQRVIGYVAANSTTAPTQAQLRDFLRHKLPDYMMPSYVFILEELPLSANGKVDRRQLPDPDTIGTTTPGAESWSHNPNADVIRGIWAEVLGMDIDDVGMQDNFFELGGHSLLATQVVSRLRGSLHLELPVRFLFENPTIVAMTEAIESARRFMSGIQAPPMLPRARSADGDPLSFAQRRLWFLAQLMPEESTYNVPAVLRLEGYLNLAILEHCLAEIVSRHEILRTTFVERDGEPYQVVRESSPGLACVDLSTLPAERRSSAAISEATREISRPFNLARDPLLRATVLRLAEREHFLVINMHHIAADGWSAAVFIRELIELYSASTAHRPSQLPALPVQYADYAQWQRQWVEDVVLPTQLDYWKNRLLGIPVLALPTDHPRPAIQAFRGAQIWRMLSPTLRRAIKLFSRRHGVSAFMTLQAAFGVLLHRYTEQLKIVIGSPIANRTHTEIENLIGFFANTLVFIVDLTGRPSFSQLLARVREDSLEAYAHQDLPFEKLVEEVHGRRDLASNPLFQVMLAMQNAPVPKLELPGLTITTVPLDTGSSKFDLLLSVVDVNDELGVILEFKTDLFLPPTAERLLTRFEVLLESALQNENCEAGALALMPPAERGQVLFEWNATSTPYPRDVCMQDLFEAEVQRHPKVAAVEAANGGLTYGELNRRSNRLAHYLRSMGVKPEVPVGLCVERSLEVIVALLGILKAGGVCVPLDPDYPSERLAFLIKDAGVTLIVVRDRYRSLVPNRSSQIRFLDIDGEVPAEYSDHNPTNISTPDQLVHIVYTSGSTGLPKGAGIPHRAVVRLVRNTNYAALTPDQVFLHISPLSFDASTLEIWGCLLNGAKLFVMPPGTPALEDLARVLEERRITILFLSAGLFHAMVDNHLGAFRNVKQFLAGGDVLSPLHVRRVLEKLPHCRLINGYGPTENTTFTACHPIVHSPEPGTTVPIGSPISNTQVYILDPDMQPAPIGVPGELYAGGDGLARGYLNRPQLTAEKFVPDAVSGTPGARLYRTGDRARFLTDGKLEFLGRRDHQVKVRGYRVELGEVESALLQEPGIIDCAVVIRSAGDIDKLIVAYVVTRDGRPPMPEDLRRFLKKRLPDYMIPHHFVHLDALPLSPQGKVDRASLPDLSSARPELNAPFVAARSKLEETICAVWREVLGVDQVGVRDNFFDLGGHSLRMVQVNSKLRQILSFPIQLLELFEYPTIESLAQHLSDQEKLLPAGTNAAEEQIQKLKQGRSRLRNRSGIGHRGK